MTVATLPKSNTRRILRRAAPLCEPGTDYSRLGGVYAMGDILARLAARLPDSTSAAFPDRAEDDKLKAS